jgi:hypothetical protein
VNDHSASTQYLTVTGVLHPDNRLVLEPGFLTSVPDHVVEDKQSALVAELFNDDGKVLLRYGVFFVRPCADGVAVAERIVASKLPFPTATRMIRFLLDGVLIHELEVPRSAPVVSLIWDPAQGTEGHQRIRWSSEHATGREMQYLLSYSHDDGRSWQPLNLPTADLERDVDFRRLPGGRRCRLRVLATDGVNTSAALSQPFRRPTQPCYAMILSPEDKATFDEGELIRFQGQGFYLEERQPEFELLDWSSSLSGPLGRGGLLELGDLSPGSHEITLTVGREGRVGTTRVTVQVRRASRDADE